MRVSKCLLVGAKVHVGRGTTHVGSVGDDGIGKREHVEDAFLQRQVSK